MELAVGLVGHEHRPFKSLFYQVLNGAGVIPVGMGNEEVLCLMNLLRCQVRYPIQPVGRGPCIHYKSVAVSLHVETISSFITASTCYKKLHIHISIRAPWRALPILISQAFTMGQWPDISYKTVLSYH